jgi:hypothetical protein
MNVLKDDCLLVNNFISDVMELNVDVLSSRLYSSRANVTGGSSNDLIS